MIPQKNIVYLDFEYCDTEEENVTPVCVCYQRIGNGVQGRVVKVWLYQDYDSQKEFRGLVEGWHRAGYVFSSYSWEAESRALLALGVDTVPFKAVDLYLEYRQLLNHNHELEYGKQLIKGKVRVTDVPPRWREEKDDSEDYSQAEMNYAAAVYKMLGKIVDTQEKHEARARIIRGGPFSAEDQKRILQYCASDVEHLAPLHSEMWTYWVDYLSSHEDEVDEQLVVREQYLRAEYAARTARLVGLGYPVDVPALRALTANIPSLLQALQRDIIARTEPELGFKFFSWDKKTKTFTRNVKQLGDWIDAKYGKKWPKRTPTKAPCLDEETLSKVSGSRHEFRDDPVDQMLRFARFNQSINGFRPLKETSKKSFYDYLGRDGRVRPYFGIYGAQSSRSQPSATGYIFLKSAALRGLVHPEDGFMIVGSDYGSEEFLLSALLSGDKKMLDAYLSGDVYMAFAIQSRAAPKGATKHTHKAIRERYKATVLAISYDMTARGLYQKIINDTGQACTEEEAQTLIDLFYETYSDFAEWKERIQSEYRQTGTVRLPCGWRMLADNQNFRSVGNMPVQGIGGSIMRKAVALGQDEGLSPIMTLHDAVYAEMVVEDWVTVDLLARVMQEAFHFYMDPYMREMGVMADIRQDIYCWGTGLVQDGTVTTPEGIVVATQDHYVDERAVKEAAMWRPYMTPSEEEFIL